MSIRQNSHLVMLVTILFILASCGGGSDSAEPTIAPEPTLTIEERRAFAFGSIENPMRMLLRPVVAVEDAVKVIFAETYAIPLEDIHSADIVEDVFDVTDDLAGVITTIETQFEIVVDRSQFTELGSVSDIVDYIQDEIGNVVEAQLFTRTGITFEIVRVDRHAEALQGLCDSGTGILSIAWLNGVGYTAAEAQGCGLPALQIATGANGYNQGLLLDIPEPEPIVEVTPEATAELTPEATAEATSEEIESADVTETPIPTETPVPTETITPEETPEVEITPEATVEFVETVLNLQFTTEGLILVNGALGTQNIDALRGRTFCRLGIDDFYTWLVPTLYMESRNIDPQRDLDETIDYNNLISLVRAVQDGDCTATGISSDTYAQLSAEYPELVEELSVSSTRIAFPYPILVYPVELDLGVRLNLDEQIVALGSDESSPLRWLLGHDEIVAFEAERFIVFDAFIETIGFDFAELGN